MYDTFRERRHVIGYAVFPVYLQLLVDALFSQEPYIGFFDQFYVLDEGTSELLYDTVFSKEPYASLESKLNKKIEKVDEST